MKRRQPPPVTYPRAKQGQLSTADACPTCGRAWDGLAVKVCQECGEVIKRGERYRMTPVGNGLVGFVHRSCDEGGGRGDE